MFSSFLWESWVLKIRCNLILLSENLPWFGWRLNIFVLFVYVHTYTKANNIVTSFPQIMFKIQNFSPTLNETWLLSRKKKEKNRLPYPFFNAFICTAHSLTLHAVYLQRPSSSSSKFDQNSALRFKPWIWISFCSHLPMQIPCSKSSKFDLFNGLNVEAGFRTDFFNHWPKQPSKTGVLTSFGHWILDVQKCPKEKMGQNVTSSLLLNLDLPLILITLMCNMAWFWKFLNFS